MAFTRTQVSTDRGVEEGPGVNKAFGMTSDDYVNNVEFGTLTIIEFFWRRRSHECGRDGMPDTCTITYSVAGLRTYANSDRNIVGWSRHELVQNTESSSGSVLYMIFTEVALIIFRAVQRFVFMASRNLTIIKQTL